MTLGEQGRTARLTIAEIATAAGVSVPTVSKVLNNHPQVSAATRQHVEQVIQSMGYVRNRAAQALAKGRSGLIDLVITRLDSEYYYEIVRGVQDAISEAGLQLVLSTTEDESQRESRWFERVIDRSTDGAILVLPHGQETYIESLRVAQMPFVIVDERSELSADVPAIAATNWAGGAQAVRHLIALGHRRIAMTRGPAFLSIKARYAGYRAALDEEGIPFRPEYVVEGLYTLDDGRRLTQQLLDLPEPPTAIFTSNDLQAAGAYRAILSRGLRIPHDISIIGFDDLPFASLLTPALTTIRQPLAEMGRHAVSLLLQQIAGKKLGTPRIELSTTLIQCDSCAPPRL